MFEKSWLFVTKMFKCEGTLELLESIINDFSVDMLGLLLI